MEAGSGAEVALAVTKCHPGGGGGDGGGDLGGVRKPCVANIDLKIQEHGL